MADDYKRAKEAFVSDTTGSSVAHVNLISLVALLSVALNAALCTRFPRYASSSFVLSFAILVLPILLSMTLYAERPVPLLISLLGATCLILFRPRCELGTPLPSVRRRRESEKGQSQNDARQSAVPSLPALTTYRAHMMLLTILAILAVDFPVFPRSLAKCETFGVSLMDLGVGSFVFSQGIVSAIPILASPGYLVTPMGRKFLRTARRCAPIIALGAVRVLLVKGTEYPEHETEYGRHWNFFITLALLPMLQVLLHPLIARVPIALIGLLTGFTHQFTLSRLGLQRYILNAPRTSLVGANKEGLGSLPGYLAIHLLGLATGTLVLAPTPSFFHKRQKVMTRGVHVESVPPSQPRQTMKTATELCAYTIVWWTLYGLLHFLKRWLSERVSRRMANLSYILWVAAFNTSFLLAYLVVLDISFFPQTDTCKRKESPGAGVSSEVQHLSCASDIPASDQSQRSHENPPRLFRAINKHGLAVFLLGNVLTGIINFGMQTMYASDAVAMMVLGGYALLLCGGVWVCGD